MHKGLLAAAGLLLFVAGGAVGWFVAPRGVAASGESPSKKEAPPDLFEAAERGQQSRVEQLLMGGAGVNDKGVGGETALMKAAMNNHVAVLRALLGKGADVDERDAGGEDALMKASANGHLAAVQVLLKKDSEMTMKAQDHRGMTALMKAAAAGHLLAVRELTEYRPFIGGFRFDPQVKDLEGKTALDHARAKGHMDIVTYLESKTKTR